MKRSVGLSGALLLCLCISAFSQVDTTYIYNASMPYGTLDIRVAKSPTRYYYLQEDVTFSYRESAPGVKTNTFRDMTAWNSAPFREGNLREKNGTNDAFIMNYRFLLPNNYNATFDPGYPIIIMFHGLGERGNCWDDNCYWGTGSWNPNTNNPPAPTTSTHNLLNNDHNLLHGGSKHLAAVNAAGSKLPDDPTLSAGAFPGIVVFPQNLNGWGSSSVQDAIRILRLVIKKYNVDENRVYIHGLSNGGGAVFQAIKRAPWLFAAALGMSAINDGGIVNDGLAPEVAKIPMWVFQGGLDVNPTPSRTYNMIRRFREAGATVRYSYYSHLGHGTWNTAYNEPDFFRWILSHRKNNPHVQYGNPVICNTTGVGVKLNFSAGFPAYQWERDGEIISDANQWQYIANTPGSYRGRFSRVTNPGPDDWEPWSKPVVVTEINPAKPIINALGSTHLRGPGLLSTTENNTVVLRSGPEAEFYNWYKDGQPLTFSGTDVHDTLRTVTFTSANTSLNGAYTMVASYSYCPSPPSDPVQLFFNNSAPVNMTFDATNANFKGVVMPSGIFLSWNDLVSNEVGYEIWRKKSGAADFTFAGRTAKDAISFYDGPLEPATTYLYKIRAISKTGTSNYVPSNDLNVNYQITTGGDHTPPVPPQDLVMTGNTLTSISLSWKSSTDNTVVKEYIISYGGNTISTGTAVTKFTIPGLQSNTIYPVTVKAVDFAGHVSPPSNQIIATTYVLGLFYKHSTGAWADLDEPSMIATWASPEFTGTLKNFSLTPRTQEDFFNFQFTGYLDILTEGAYVFRVTSNDGSRLLIDNATVVDNDGQHGNIGVTGDTVYLTAGPHPLELQYFDYVGSQSLTVQYKGPDLTAAFKTIPDSLLRSGKFIPPTPPTAPVSVIATANGMEQIDISWQYTTPGEVEVYRGASATGVFQILGRSYSTSFTDTVGLNPAVTYFYKLKTINGAGSSPFTTAVSATTGSDAGSPTVPGTITLNTKSHTQVAITWIASTDNVAVKGYEIFVNGQLAGNSSTLSFTGTGLLPNTTYNFTVRAFDASGNRSAFTAPFAVTTNPSAVFYSLATGNLSDLATWRQNQNGTGNSPVNFTENGQYFIVSNRTVTGMGGAWEVSGSASKVIVPNGVTLTADNAFTGPVELEGSATLVLNHSVIPQLQKLSPTSTVNFNVAADVPAVNFGNLILSGTGIKNFAADTINVAGNLTVASGITMKGASGNASTLIVNGNITAQGANGLPGADNRIHVHFSSGVAHTVSASNDLYFYKLTTGPSSTVTFLTAGNPYDVVTGSLNGGGVTLANGSQLTAGTNTLVLTGAGSLNAQNETGRLSINGGDLRLSSDTSAQSHLYLDPAAHLVDTLQVDFSGTGSLVIHEALSIAGAIKIDQGTLNANGQITLLSTAAKTATIAQIENGAITGNVTVQHYLPPLGDSWRDLSTPVNGIKVADWQNYFPVTGSFTGASAGPGLTADASMYISNGSGLIAYPGAGGSNQSPIQQGRGYVTRINSSSPITVNATGVPFQGDVNFALAAGTGGGADNGWTLVGNPYASPVTWSDDADAWVKSSVSNTIAVKENTVVNGQAVAQYRYYNPSLGSGTILAGQAFWVQAYGQTPALTIKEKAKGVAPVYPGPQQQVPYLSVSLQQGGLSDATYILFTPNATDGFDNQFDALKKANSGMFNLSSVIGSNTYAAINNLPDAFCSKEVKLNIQNALPGSYSLSFGTFLTGIGAVSLKDNFTGAVSSITSPYPFTITGDPNSYGANRFVITFTRTALDIATPKASAGTICADDEAVVNITQTQASAEYVVLNSAGEVISDTAEGNGSSIMLTVDKSKLISGVNNLRVRAGFKGCATQILTSQPSMSFTPEFSIESANDVSVCIGEHAMLQASGAPGGSYKWYAADTTEISGQHSATFTTPAMYRETVYYVAGVTAGGCESILRTIHVYADSLDKPVITMFNDTLFVQVEGTYQWKKDGQSLQGVVAPFYKPSVSGQYTVVAFKNGCAKESEPFTYFVDPGCQVDTQTPVVEAGNTCGAASVAIKISNTQSGVKYTAIDKNDEAVSSAVESTGGMVELELNGENLEEGMNQIRIRADLDGCVNRILASVLTFDYVPFFAVDAPETIVVCNGNTATITVSGVPEGGHYVWYNGNGQPVAGITNASFTTQPVTSATILWVAAVHSSGCESEKKKITVTPVTPFVPVITFENNVLTTDAQGSYEWKLNGTPVPEATGSSFTPVTPGSYTVKVANGQCVSESAAYPYFVTAISPGRSSEFIVNVYPVPATSVNLKVAVQSPKNEKVTIEMVDITGRPVFRQVYTFDEVAQGIPIDPVKGYLPNGVYCIIATQSGIEIRKRIIIEN